MLHYLLLGQVGFKVPNTLSIVFYVGSPKEDIFLEHHQCSIIQSSHSYNYKCPAGPLRASYIFRLYIHITHIQEINSAAGILYSGWVSNHMSVTSFFNFRSSQLVLFGKRDGTTAATRSVPDLRF